MVRPAGWAELANAQTKSKATVDSPATMTGRGEGQRAGDSGQSRL